MESLRSSPRLDRRRRVLTDESRNAAQTTPRIYRGGDDTLPTPPPYGVAALDSLHAPLISYLPIRRFNLLIWFLAGWIPILGIAALAAHRPAWENSIEPGALRAFDLAVAGNLANWLSSAAFAFAAAVMLAIYSVRRHRRDDYRARFTVWLWAIPAAAFASVDATAGLHHAWQGLCQSVADAPRGADGTIWWVGAWTIVFGGLILRLLFEVRASRCAVFWTCWAACCYGAAGLMKLDLLPLAQDNLQPILETTILLAGHHGLVLALVVYARHVVLEASGQAAPVKRGRRIETATAAASADSDAPDSPAKPVPRPAARRPETLPDQETNAAPTTSAPTSAARPQLKAVSADDADDADDDSHSENPADKSVAGKLSRAERKRLRREQRKRMAA